MRKFFLTISIIITCQLNFSASQADGDVLFYGFEGLNQQELSNLCPQELASYLQEVRSSIPSTSRVRPEVLVEITKDSTIRWNSSDIMRHPDAGLDVYLNEWHSNLSQFTQVQRNYYQCVLSKRATICVSQTNGMPIPCHPNANTPTANIQKEENIKQQTIAPQPLTAKPPEPEVQEPRPVHTPPHLEIVQKIPAVWMQELKM